MISGKKKKYIYIYIIYMSLERFIVALVMRYDTNGVK